MLPVFDASLFLVEEGGGKSRRRRLGDEQCKLAAIQVSVQSIQHRTNSKVFAKCRAYETICRTYTREKSINWVALNTFSPQESVLRSPVAAGLFLTPKPFNVDLVMSANKQAKLYRHIIDLRPIGISNAFLVFVVSRFVSQVLLSVLVTKGTKQALFSCVDRESLHTHTQNSIDLKLMISKLSTISAHYITYTAFIDKIRAIIFTLSDIWLAGKWFKKYLDVKLLHKRAESCQSTWFEEFFHFLLIYGPYLISHIWQHPQWNKTSARDSAAGSAPANTCKTYGSHWWRRSVARIASHSQISLSAGLHTFFILLRTIRVSLEFFRFLPVRVCSAYTQTLAHTLGEDTQNSENNFFCLFCSRRRRNWAVLYADCLETYRSPLDINGSATTTWWLFQWSRGEQVNRTLYLWLKDF